MAQYTNNTPQGSQQIATTQPLILGNFEYLEDVVDKDHNFSGDSTNPTDGYHKVAHYITQTSPVDPVAIPGVLQTYSRITNGLEQFRVMDGSGNISQLTGNVNALQGYQWIGGALLQWGFVSITSSGSGNITFPIPFPNGVFHLTGSPTFVNFPSSGASVAFRRFVNGAPPPPLAIPNLTTAPFYFFTDSGQYTGFFWLAVGN